MKLLKWNFAICLVIALFVIIDASEYELADIKSMVVVPAETGLISKMIERGKILMKAIPRTGLKLAGRVWDVIPTPETIFNVGKQTLIGLPQELIAYAVHSVC